jgi:hypothetical protein
MRLYHLSPLEVEAIVHAGSSVRTDKKGRPVFAGRSSDRRLVEVVVALDIPDYVITVMGETR